MIKICILDEDDNVYEEKKSSKGLGLSKFFLLTIPHKFGTAGARLGHKKTKLPRNQNIKRRSFKNAGKLSYQQRSWNFNFLPGGILRWRICMQRGHYLALQGLHHGDAKPCNYITYITIILLILQLYYLAIQGFIMVRLNHTMCIRYFQTITTS